MTPIILFRAGFGEAQEFEIAKKYFPMTRQRNAVPPNSLVIGRYSVLPYYKELEEDLKINGSQLLNSYSQHKWIANFDYYDTVKQYTFETWDDSQYIPDVPLVVKGRTNSRKGYWNTKMFAENKKTALEISFNLMEDPLIAEQGVIFRRYEPLVTYEIGINEQRFTNEWRFFFHKTDMLSYGYYWQNAMVIQTNLDPQAIALAKEIAEKVSEYANFFVLDLAEKKSGGWVLVEINDGEMSGLSENDPDMLYSNLRKSIDKG